MFILISAENGNMYKKITEKTYNKNGMMNGERGNFLLIFFVVCLSTSIST